MHHGATYIHTKNEAGDNRLQHHNQGKQVSSTFTATALTLGVVFPPLQSHCLHRGAGPLGEGGRERKGCMPLLVTGEGWAVTARGTGFSVPGCPESHHRSLSILARGEMRGIPFRLTPTLDSSCGPRFLPGGPHSLCQPRGTIWNVLVLGNQERLGLPMGSGMQRKGCTQTSQTRRMGQGLVARGRGWGSAEVPGSWRGRESGKARTDRHNCTSRSGERRERAMLGAQRHLPSLRVP